MLTISKLASVDYYLDVASPDYLFRPGEPPGKWWGKGAELLGLKGVIKPEALKALWEGFILGDRPDSASGGSAERIPLVQNAGSPNRSPGEDCCFAPHKSVSVEWSQLGPTLRKTLEKCHEGAAVAALEYLSQTAIMTRRGKRGVIREHALPVVAMYEHGSNRELEPHLHTHCLILNVCIRADGTTGAIDEKILFHHKMAGGALYQAELDHLLQRELKARTRRKHFSIAIDGVPQKLCDLHSTRAKQIKEQLAKTGFKTARAAEIAAKDTRRPKIKPPPSRSELLRRWRSVNEHFGFDDKAANKLVGRKPRKLRMPDLKKLAAKAVKHYQQTEAMFYEQEIIRYVAREVLGYGVSAREIIQTVREFLKENPDVVSLNKRHNQANYSTKHMLAMEAAIRDAVDRGKSDRSHMVRCATYDRLIAKRFAPDHTLSEDDRMRNSGQKRALSHITCTPGNKVVVEGVAGSGKTYLLSVAREMWERDGYNVYGMCLSGAAAEGLERDTGIKSETVRMWLTRLNRVGNYTYHQKRQLKRLIQGKRTYAYSGRRHTLNSKSIVVLDEAAMVGTKDMLEIINQVEKAGAKLVLIGERRQLQPIAAGGPMGPIIAVVDKSELQHVTRQKLEPDDPVPEWHRRAHQKIADGAAAFGLNEFVKRGRLTVHADRGATQFALVQDWSLKGIKQPLDNIILTGYSEEAPILSRICQQARWDSGELVAKSYFELGDKRFYVGDVVLMTEVNRRYGVNNGDRGVIQGINLLTGTVKIHFPHKDATTVIPFREYTHIDLGYAMTTHKAQGVTKPNVFILLGGSLQDRHLTYVQASRAQFSTRLYVDKHNAGYKLKKLIEDVERARPKQNASDWLHGPRKCESEFVDPDSVKFKKPTRAGRNQSADNHKQGDNKKDSTKSRSLSKTNRAKKQHSRPGNDQPPPSPQSAKPDANSDPPSLSDATLPPRPEKRSKQNNGKRTKRSGKSKRGNFSSNTCPPPPSLRDATLPPADPTPASAKHSANTNSGRAKTSPSGLNAGDQNSQHPRQQETQKAEGKRNGRPDGPPSANKQNPKKANAVPPRTPPKDKATSPPPTPNKTPTGRSEKPASRQPVKQPAKARPQVPRVPPLPRGYRPRDARDLSHVNIVKTTDPAVLETAIDRYGKLPGGIVTEGAASCDFRIHSLRIDPQHPAFLIVNERVRYDTGLSPEEVAILWHAVVETKNAQENFGVLSQREPIAVHADTIVASQMMKADNWLGGLVYGYDSNYKLATSRRGDYRNPFVEEIKHVTEPAYLRMLGVNQILGLAPQFFLKVSDAEFTQVDDHFIASFATKITMAIGVIDGPHIVVTRLPHFSQDRPLIESQFPWVHAAFNHCARYVREYAQREPSLAKAIAYCELVLLLRKGLAGKANMETPDHLDDALARRQRIDLPRYDYCQSSPAFSDAAKSAAGALLSHKYEEPQESILAGLLATDYAAKAADPTHFCKARGMAINLLQDFKPKADDYRWWPINSLLQENATQLLNHLSTRSQDVRVDQCFNLALAPNTLEKLRPVYFKEALSLCHAASAVEPATHCRWLQIHALSDPNFDVVNKLLSPGAFEGDGLLPYTTLNRIRLRKAYGPYIETYQAVQKDAVEECKHKLHLFSCPSHLVQLWKEIESSRSTGECLTMLDYLIRCDISLLEMLTAYQRRAANDTDPYHAASEVLLRRLRAKPTLTFSTRLLHPKNPFGFAPEYFTHETEFSLRRKLDLVRPSVEKFGPTPDTLAAKMVKWMKGEPPRPPAEKWWSTYGYGGTVCVNGLPTKVLIAYELKARGRTVYDLHRTMVEHRIKNPQEALFVLDLGGNLPEGF